MPALWQPQVSWVAHEWAASPGWLPSCTHCQLLEDCHTQRLGSQALHTQTVLALFSPEQSNNGKRAAVLGGTSLFNFVCQLLMPTKTKKNGFIWRETSPWAFWRCWWTWGCGGYLYCILLLECVTTGEEKRTHCYHLPGSLGVLLEDNWSCFYCHYSKHLESIEQKTVVLHTSAQLSLQPASTVTVKCGDHPAAASSLPKQLVFWTWCLSFQSVFSPA